MFGNNPLPPRSDRVRLVQINFGMLHTSAPSLFPCSVCVFERLFRRSDPTRGAAKEGRKIASDLTFTPPSPPFVEIEWGDWISRFAAKFSRMYGL